MALAGKLTRMGDLHIKSSSLKSFFDCHKTKKLVPFMVAIEDPFKVQNKHW